MMVNLYKAKEPLYIMLKRKRHHIRQIKIPTKIQVATGCDGDGNYFIENRETKP